ncbi:MAG: hypothetical protein I3J02_04190 [Prevotella sp.]|nr:hypothetical protein [Prevotella sp.]
MRKNFIPHFLLATMVSIVLSSCAALGFRSSLPQLSKISQGQTYQEVTQIMKGSPNFRRFTEDGLEQWEYHRNKAISGDYDVVLIGFRKGRVVSMDSFPYVYPKNSTIPTQEK